MANTRLSVRWVRYRDIGQDCLHDVRCRIYKGLKYPYLSKAYRVYSKSTCTMSSTPNNSALSDTLQQISLIKIAELNKKHNVYNTRKKEALNIATTQHAGSTPGSHIQQLAKNVSRINVPFIDKSELNNVFRYLDQARFDPSVPEAEIARYEQWLLTHLNHQSNRFSHANLFSAVLSQHLNHVTDAAAQESDESMADDDSLDGSFEILTRDRLQQLKEKFEDVVFNEYSTDETAIQDYLKSLFPGDLNNTMNGLHDRLTRDTTAIFQTQDPFDDDVLQWVIGGLLHNDLLRDDQKMLLKNFRKDDLVRAEICDVLNMKWAELRTWQWTDDDAGLDVEPRKQLNGKYRVVMQEDVLQSMLVHYIGVRLCVNAKEEMKYWLEDVMELKDPLTQDEKDRRKFYTYIDSNASSRTLARTMDCAYWDDIFLSQLPSSVEDTGGYEDDTEEKDAKNKKKSWLQIKQQVLHHVASKVLIDRKLYDDVAVVQTDLQWFATSIPHSTIYAVLKFCGLSEEWIAWFRAYLEVPLNMSKTAGEEQQVRKRKRGVPIAHALEKYLGEMILVFLDVAVRREAGLLLYRMHDDIMLCGSTEQCEKAWATMQNFVQIMGLEFNKKKTGSISLNGTTSQKAKLPDGDVAVDFLKLSPDGGVWVIDNEMVNGHVKQLRKQLDEADDILSFVRTYNSCIGRFFGHTFGLPAHCLGLRHVKDILQTHHRMQNELFGQDGIVAVLKEKLNALARKEGLPDDFEVSDSFIHTPILLGGLGVTNPFISLLLTKTNFLGKTPEQHVDEFLKAEKNTYNICKRRFEGEDMSSRKKRRAKILEHCDSPESAEKIIDVEKYWSFEAWHDRPEWTSINLLMAYEMLMKDPGQSNVLVSSRVTEDLKRLTQGGAKNVNWDELTVEERYKVQMYSESMFNTFGTVAIVDRTLAPLGVMKAIMDEKVTWQMVL